MRCEQEEREEMGPTTLAASFPAAFARLMTRSRHSFSAALPLHRPATDIWNVHIIFWRCDCPCAELRAWKYVETRWDGAIHSGLASSRVKQAADSGYGTNLSALRCDEGK